jgi:uncharacterized protein YcbK (DUF882 family)
MGDGGANLALTDPGKDSVSHHGAEGRRDGQPLDIVRNAGSQVAFRVARNALTGIRTSRAGRCIGLAALVLLLGNRSLQNAVAEGDTRTISFHHIHTGEELTVTFKRNGRYDPAALKQLNHLMRDWRRNEEVQMDPRLFDIIWEVQREVGSTATVQVICGYRAPATNAMLRRRSRGVAQFSQHTLGKAIDFYIPGASLEAQREAGLRLQRGGVGYYPSSGSPFVHMDVGSVRHWPRMTHEELARVFPDGRTVHVPSDGRPLRNYALALADIERRGSSPPSHTSLAAARTAGVNVNSAEKPRGLLASLFGSRDDEDESEAAAPAGGGRVAVESKAESKPEKVAAAQPVPLPVARPAQAAPKSEAAALTSLFNLASAESRPVRIASSDPAAPGSANDVIASRGFWESSAADAAPAPAAGDRAPLASAKPVPRWRAGSPAPASDATGAIAALPVKSTDADERLPADLALAYAAQTEAPSERPAARTALPVKAPAPRAAASLKPEQDAALAKRGLQAEPVATAVAPVSAAPGKAEVPPDDPWLRALVLAPDLRNYMTALAFLAPDPRALTPLMHKPGRSVVMTFSDNPHLGMTTDRFSGSAVVFVSTVTFARQTAMLR